MKLSDFERVGALMKEREYIKALIAFSGVHQKMTIGSVDIRPDLKDRIVGPLTTAFKAELARVDADLSSLGVVL